MKELKSSFSICHYCSAKKQLIESSIYRIATTDRGEKRKIQVDNSFATKEEAMHLLAQRDICFQGDTFDGRGITWSNGRKTKFRVVETYTKLLFTQTDPSNIAIYNSNRDNLID